MKFDPKPFEEYDVDIKVDFCGVCGSDLHTYCVLDGFVFQSQHSDRKLIHVQAPTMYPVIVGHEIVGAVVRV